LIIFSSAQCPAISLNGAAGIVCTGIVTSGVVTGVGVGFVPGVESDGLLVVFDVGFVVAPDVEVGVVGAELVGVGLAGVGLAGVGLAGVGLAGVGLAGVGLAGVGLAGVGLAGVGEVANGLGRLPMYTISPYCSFKYFLK